MHFPSPASMAATSSSPTTPASRSWSSIPRRCAATRRNMPACSSCGARYQPRGLMIVGVPSNDFGGQEPGTAGRHQAHRARPTQSAFRSPPRSQVKGAEPAPVLQMGSDRAPAGNPALELPQIPGRPRRPHRRGLSDRDRTDGCPRRQRGCQGALTGFQALDFRKPLPQRLNKQAAILGRSADISHLTKSHSGGRR